MDSDLKIDTGSSNPELAKAICDHLGCQLTPTLSTTFSDGELRIEIGDNVRGDDVFVVGAWDDVLEMSVDLYRAFKCFNGGKLTFSAGIGFFEAKTPISFMAEETGKLESFAKNNPDKNSISLFGFDSEIYNENSNLSIASQTFIDFMKNNKL